MDPCQTQSRKTSHLVQLPAWCIQPQVLKKRAERLSYRIINLRNLIYFIIIHQAGYSVVRSLSEAPKYASVIAKVLKQGQVKDGLANGRSYGNISMQGEPVFVFKSISRRPFYSVHVSFK